jgi:hypothetical protein
LAASVYRRQSPGRQRALLLGLMAAMISILAHGLVDHSFFLLDLAYVFSLILGVVVSMQKTPPLSNDTAESNDAVRIDS